MPNWMNQYQDAFNQAKSANESRYSDILGGYDARLNDYETSMNSIGAGYQARFDNVMASLAGVGQSQRQQLSDSFAANMGNTRQSAIQRGIGNSTVLDSLTRGVQSDNEKAKTQLSDSLSRQNADYSMKLSGDTLGFMTQKASGIAGMQKEELDFKERRTDAYPDINIYAALSKAGGSPAALGGGFTTAGGGSRAAFAAMPQTPDPAIMAMSAPPSQASLGPMMQPPGGFLGGSTGLVEANNMNSYNSWVNAAMGGGGGAAAGAIGGGVPMGPEGGLENDWGAARFAGYAGIGNGPIPTGNEDDWGANRFMMGAGLYGSVGPAAGLAGPVPYTGLGPQGSYQNNIAYPDETDYERASRLGLNQNFDLENYTPGGLGQADLPSLNFDWDGGISGGGGAANYGFNYGAFGSNWNPYSGLYADGFGSGYGSSGIGGGGPIGGFAGGGGDW